MVIQADGMKKKKNYYEEGGESGDLFVALGFINGTRTTQ